MRVSSWVFLALPGVAWAGPFSGHTVLGEMSVSWTDPTGLIDAEVSQLVADVGVVGPGHEVEIVVPSQWGDFSDVDMTLTVATSTWWAPAAFDGLRFSLTSPGAPSLAGAYLISTTVQHFSPSQITSDHDTVALNFQGMQGAIGEVVIGFVDQPLVEASGACPGLGRVTFEHFSPGGNIAVVRGAAVGASTVPGGPCAGAALPLDAPRLVAMLGADANGDQAVSPTFGGGLCGDPLVAVDMMTCRVTPLAFVP